MLCQNIATGNDTFQSYKIVFYLFFMKLRDLFNTMFLFYGKI